MEIILGSIYTLLPVLHIFAVLGLLLKIILPIGFDSLNPVYVITSYFKFYDKEANDSGNAWRRLYVKLNNFINYYTYIWLFICIMCLIAFGDLGFNQNN